MKSKPTTIPETLLHQERMRVFRAAFMEFWNAEARPKLLELGLCERAIAQQMIETWREALCGYLRTERPAHSGAQQPETL